MDFTILIRCLSKKLLSNKLNAIPANCEQRCSNVDLFGSQTQTTSFDCFSMSMSSSQKLCKKAAICSTCNKLDYAAGNLKQCSGVSVCESSDRLSLIATQCKQVWYCNGECQKALVTHIAALHCKGHR